MPFVSSSAISRYEYDPKTMTLQIWFVESGGPYDYYRVPQAVVDGFARARSKGTYFNDHIKDRYSAR